MKKNFIGFVLIAAVSLSAQDAPKFEVVSIKDRGRQTPFDQDGRFADIVLGPMFGVPSFGFQAGGYFEASGQPVLALLLVAFGDRSHTPALDEFSGLSSWALTENYAIEAKVGGDLAGTKIDTLSEVGRSLVRSILDDKFKLQAHLEAHMGRQPTIVIDHIERPTED